MSTSSSIAEILDRWRDIEIEDEDGEDVMPDLKPPAGAEAIGAFADRLSADHKRELPAGLKAFFEAANGGDLWRCELHGVGHGEFLDGSSVDGLAGEFWIGFHNWGNGDFDYIVTAPSSRYMPGSVVFYSHETGRHALVSGSIEEWLTRAAEDHRANGGLAHPYDYIHAPEMTGMYRSVFDAIKH